MKITKKQLEQLIKEEVTGIVEFRGPFGDIPQSGSGKLKKRDPDREAEDLFGKRKKKPGKKVASKAKDHSVLGPDRALLVSISNEIKDLKTALKQQTAMIEKLLTSKGQSVSKDKGKGL